MNAEKYQATLLCTWIYTVFWVNYTSKQDKTGTKEKQNHGLSCLETCVGGHILSCQYIFVKNINGWKGGGREGSLSPALL